MLTQREMFLQPPDDEYEAKAGEPGGSAPQQGTAAPADLGGLEQLGTPPEIRNSRPQIPASDAAFVARVVGTAGHVSAMEPWDAHPVGRRHGLRGFLDSIMYRWQLLLLSVYGPAEQTRQADPIEQLKRKYGRLPREY
ncbi:MAG: hypothetical protein WC005_03610 [Candidatus Nanopelagicales bacterium]